MKNNPNNCDENHCFCDKLDEHGDIKCEMENTRPSLQEAIDRLIATTDEISREIEKIKSVISTKK